MKCFKTLQTLLRSQQEAQQLPNCEDFARQQHDNGSVSARRAASLLKPHNVAAPQTLISSGLRRGTIEVGVRHLLECAGATSATAGDQSEAKTHSRVKGAKIKK